MICISALDEVTVKSNQLEQELARANKTIQKSKKAVEVQQLLKENQSLNQKLSTQDEDFRLQNQTLLQELSKVGSSHIHSKYVCENFIANEYRNTYF